MYSQLQMSADKSWDRGAVFPPRLCPAYHAESVQQTAIDSRRGLNSCLWTFRVDYISSRLLAHQKIWQ
ncbi:hypothetical protein Y032_0002g808 [Ancylostoma ceylanicum]|uniref:Uncharacterized protein n=1 Tax=Ancylostoma ceylanicum TaxID=53326 RepID=A0A016W0S4_9BILA|nr:hypothetical protein Y032_0002g808 [Ancylostoma ceylanicum]